MDDTSTHLDILPLPDRKALINAFKGKKISQLRTPAAVVDKKVFEENSERVVKEAKKRGMGFRIHVKTHKTLEGTRIQLKAGGGITKVIASTLVEVHQIIPLIEEGLIDDVLYSMPIGQDKIHDLASVQMRVGDRAVIRVMVDHSRQVELLQEYNDKRGRKEGWAVFVKVDGGGRRAGAPPTSDQMRDLLKAIHVSSAVSIFGFYSHFGQSYASDSLSKASDFFQGEVHCVNSAAQFARSLGLTGSWVLSVGATPTAHAATTGPIHTEGLEGSLELHAGNYCMCDLQQHATSLVPINHLALTIVTRVVSLYSDRDEAMCDCGGIAVSKDTGPTAGYGKILSPEHATGWYLAKVSQEHGVLRRLEGGKGERNDTGEVDAQGEDLQIGDLVRLVPQHACLVCAAHPWLYVVDGGDEVVDVWIPWKGW